MNGNVDNSRKSNLASLAMPGLILIALGISYFTYRAPLETARPMSSAQYHVPGPPSPKGSSAVFARLWQDPLSVAYEDRDSRQGGEPPTLLQRLFGPQWKRGEERENLKVLQDRFKTIVETIPKGKKLLYMPVLLSGGPYSEDREQRMRIRYAVLSALGTGSHRLKFPERLTYVEVPVVLDFQGVKRHARQSRFTIPLKLYGVDEVKDEHHGQTEFSKVLVCWLNESQLASRPLAVIAQILEQLFCEIPDEDRRECIELTIVGPTSSDVLLAMANESMKWKELHEKASFHEYADVGKVLRKVYFKAIKHGEDRYFESYSKSKLYSPRATVSPESLTDGHEDALKAFLENSNKNSSGLTVTRTIGTDRELVKALKEELHLRKAWPHPGAKKHLVLVTERDTLYGRALPLLFKEAISDTNDLEKATSKTHHPVEAASETDHLEEPISKEYFHVFKYLRGIDGRLPVARDEKIVERKDSSEGDEDRWEAAEDPRPTGRSQVDYLRRLERQVIGLQERLRQDGGSIRAIGVVGTDLYDKLLVLRALRRHFPQACFFTTDLEAYFSHPSEYQYTRNLLVASHFGLELKPEPNKPDAVPLQHDVPAFRDSYQTALFFTCMLALKHHHVKKFIEPADGKEPDPWGLRKGNTKETFRLEPLVFEIGRNGPYQLTIPSTDASKTIHPHSPRERRWLHGRRWFLSVALLLLLLLLLAILLIGTMNTGRNAVRRWWTAIMSRGSAAGWSIAGIPIVMALGGLWLSHIIWVDHQSPGGEPFHLFAGISVWPPTLIRLATALLSVGLLLKGKCDLAKNQETPEKETPEKETPEEWREYLGQATQWSHVLVLASIFCLFGLLLFTITDTAVWPYRGEKSRILAWAALVSAGISMSVLLFFVVDAIRGCHGLVLKSGEDVRNLSTESFKALNPGKLSEEVACSVLTIDLIAERTTVVERIVVCPFVVLLLILLSLHPIFDYQALSVPLIVLMATYLILPTIAVFELRRVAEKARREVLKGLSNYLMAFTGKGDTNRVDQCTQVISQVRDEDRGAFRPLLRSWLGASLLGGTSGVVIIEQVMRFL